VAAVATPFARRLAGSLAGARAGSASLPAARFGGRSQARAFELRVRRVGAAAQTSAASGVFGALRPPAGEAGPLGGHGEGGARGEVKDLRYATHSSRERSGPAGKRGYPDGDALLGVDMPPGSADTWLMAVMIVAGVLLAAFLFAGDRRRSRWLPRRPR
jgi:hypothetical protein